MFRNSPIEFIDTLYENNLYIKREDKLPFSYGGNKVRFAYAFLQDMQKQNKNAIIAYGSKSSNLCRVLAQLCFDKKIPCAVVFSEDDSHTTNNSKIVNSLGVREYCCDKSQVSKTVQKAIDDFVQQGYNPYYIYGSTLGTGNELTPVRAYKEVYDEILAYEQAESTKFDYIFLATGTAASYSGLVCGALEHKHKTRIVGISVARPSDRCVEIICNNIAEHFGSPQEFTPVISDKYLFGGYSLTCPKELCEIDYIFDRYQIPLDPTYTGKAFFGMKEYLKEHNIKNKNILFIHTGGYPIFCDYKNISL